MTWFARRTSNSDTGRAEGSATVTTVLPSALPGLHFTAVLGMEWTVDDDAPATVPVEVRVRSHLRKSAAQASRRCSVLAVDQASDEVLLALAATTPVPGTPAVFARLVAADLTAAPEVIGQALDHLAVRRHQLLRTQQIRLQTEALRAILSEPGLAHAWWLAHGRGELDGDALKVIGTVTRAVMETGALPDPDNDADPVAHDIALVLSRLTAAEKRMLIGRLPELVKLVGRTDIADDLPSSERSPDDTPAWLDG